MDKPNERITRDIIRERICSIHDEYIMYMTGKNERGVDNENLLYRSSREVTNQIMDFLDNYSIIKKKEK